MGGAAGRVFQEPGSPPGYFMWTIDNFFFYPQHITNRCIMSPSFSYLGTQWQFKIWPSAKHAGMEFTSLHLIYVPSSYDVQQSFYDFHFGIRGADGLENLVCSGNKMLSRYTKSEDLIVHPSLWKRDRELVAPGGCLTIFCILQEVVQPSVSVQDTSSQTEGVQVSGFGQDVHCTSKVQDASSQTEVIQVSGFGKEAYCTFKIQDVSSQTHGVQVSGSGQQGYCASKGTEKLTQDFKNLFLSEMNADVTLIVGNRQFHVHKCVLRARSAVFQAMFEHDMIERNRATGEIKDCDPDAFCDLLTYLYTGRLDELSSVNVVHLYKVADKYCVEDLKAECVDFIKSSLTFDMFYDVVNLAQQYDERELLQNCINFFAENLEVILVSPAWQIFVRENPIASNELYIKALKNMGFWRHTQK